MPHRISLPCPGFAIRGCGTALSFVWLFLTLLSCGIDLPWLPESWQAGFAYEVDNDFMPTGTFLTFHISATTALAILVWNAGENAGARTVLFFALAMRIIAVFGEPIHESDFYRYVWDGESALAGVNPYRFEPGALLLRDAKATEPFPDPETSVMWKARSFSLGELSDLEKLDGLRRANPEWFDRIGHKAVPTIYPPIAQYVFAVSAGVFGWSVYGLKAIVLLFDIGTVFLILSILKRLGRNPAWALLYAWHPLVVKESANSAHYDPVPIFFCVLALWLALTRPVSVQRAALIGFVLGLGTLAKYFAVLLLPILLWKKLTDRSLWIGTATFIASVVAGFLPFALWSDVGWLSLFDGLRIYGERWQYNPGVFSVFRRVLELAGDAEAFRHAGWLCASVLMAIVAWLTLKSRVGVAEKCFVAMGSLFVLGPTAFPWYLCWALAFLPFRPRWSWIVLSVLIPLNYLDFKSESVAPFAFEQIGGFYVLSGAIWVVFGVCWIVENAQGKSRCLAD